MSCMSERRHQRLGFTLAESLLVLVILSMAATVLMTARPQTSPRLERLRSAADLSRTLAEARLIAIRDHKTITLEDFAPACSEENNSVSIFPDGTALGGPFYINSGAETHQLFIDALNAQLIIGDAK
jgi:prepilin-type N-terminal cleavage/methylation domain-containing protein